MWYPSGKGSVCKTVIGWFDSNPHLKRIAQKAVLFFRAGHGKAAVRLHILGDVQEVPNVIGVLDARILK